MSVSVSFDKTFPVAGVSSFTVFTSLFAIGASLTGATKIVNSAVSVEFPSVTV